MDTYSMLVERFKVWDDLTFYVPFYGDQPMVNVGLANPKDFSIQAVMIRNAATGLPGHVEAWIVGAAKMPGPFFPRVTDVYSSPEAAQIEINSRIVEAVAGYRVKINRIEAEIDRLLTFEQDTQ